MGGPWKVRLDKNTNIYEGDRKVGKYFNLRSHMAEFMSSRGYFDGPMGR